MNSHAELDTDQIKQRLQLYYEAYYSEVRRHLEAYNSIADLPDDHLVGRRRIVAELGTDGVLVTHWPADDDSFEFDNPSSHTVKDLAEERAIRSPSGKPIVRFINYPSGVNFAPQKIWASEVLLANGQIVKPDWVRVEAISSSALTAYDETLARENAAEDVQIIVAAHLMGLAQVPRDKKEARVLTELEAAIHEFATLLDSDPEEREIQAYLGLSRNRILLEPTAVEVTTKVMLGNEYRIDFVLHLPQQRHLFVALERPRDRLYTEEGDPARRHKHGQQQIMDWIEWLDENKDYARKHVPALRTVKEPEYRLIIGRRSHMSEDDQRALTRKNVELHRIETMTFDDLLDRAKQFLDNLRNL